MLDIDTYRTPRRRPPSRFFAVEAEELLRNGQVENATELCKRGLVYFPDNISGYAVLAQAYALLGQQERGFHVLEDGYRRTGAEGLNTLRQIMQGEYQPLFAETEDSEEPVAETGAIEEREEEVQLAATPPAETEGPEVRGEGIHQPELQETEQEVFREESAADEAPEQEPERQQEEIPSIGEEESPPETIPADHAEEVEEERKEEIESTELVEVGQDAESESAPAEAVEEAEALHPLPTAEPVVVSEVPESEENLFDEVSFEPSEIIDFSEGDNSAPEVQEEKPVEPARDEQELAVQEAGTAEIPSRPEPPAMESVLSEDNPTGITSIESGEEEPDAGGLNTWGRQSTHQPKKPEREENSFGATHTRKVQTGRGGLSLHSGTKISRLSSSNLRLIPGLEFAPLRRDDELKIKIAPLVNEPPPDLSLTFGSIIPGIPSTEREETASQSFGHPDVAEELEEEKPISEIPAGAEIPEQPEKESEEDQEMVTEEVEPVDLFPEIPPIKEPGAASREPEQTLPHGRMTPLEELARRLETARIPIVAEEEESYDNPAFEPSIVSDTFAAILVGQGAYAEAIKAYQMLARLKPDRREEYERRIADLRRKMG